MVKKGLLFLTALCFCYGSANALPKTTSSFAINLNSGEVISSERPDVVRHPASLTKLMTLYLTFEAIEHGKLRMDTPLKISRHAVNQKPSRIDIKAGETITVENAIKAVIVKSANDCAVVLAEALAPTEREFAVLMNNKAQKLGMKKTVFKNASGLNNKEQVSTVRDMAILGSSVYKHFPKYYHLFSLQNFEYNGKTYLSHNNVLKKFKGADGMKTGFLNAAGFNIITSAERDGNRILAVTMGHQSAKKRDDKVMKIMESGLNKIALNSTKTPDTVMVKLEIPRLIASEKTTGPALRYKISKGQWGIQLGSFSNYSKAYKFAKKLQDDMVEMAPYPINVEPAEVDMAIVYRSQITNLTQKDAEELCNRLKKENMSCIVKKNENNSKLTMAAK